MNKKQLYESIMRQVSKEVKNAINEMSEPKSIEEIIFEMVADYNPETDRDIAPEIVERIKNLLCDNTEVFHNVKINNLNLISYHPLIMKYDKIGKALENIPVTKVNLINVLKNICPNAKCSISVWEPSKKYIRLEVSSDIKRVSEKCGPVTITWE